MASRLFCQAKTNGTATQLHNPPFAPPPSSESPSQTDVEPPAKAGTFPADILADVTRYSILLKGHKSVATTEIDRLVEQMLGPDGLVISDRRFRLSAYPKCFVGSEAVSWMIRTQKAMQIEAFRLGQLLVDRGVVHHASDEHGFKDEHLFYRFYKDEV